MRVPVKLFDIFLQPNGPRLLSVAREPDASQLIKHLTELAAAGALFDADGAAVAPRIHYGARSAVVEIPHVSIAVARAAGVEIDDTALAQAFAEKIEAEAPPPEPEPTPIDEALDSPVAKEAP